MRLADRCSGWLLWLPISWALNSNPGRLWMKIGLCLCVVLQHRRPGFGLSQALAWFSAPGRRAHWRGAWHRGVQAVRLTGVCNGRGQGASTSPALCRCAGGTGKGEDIWWMVDGWMDAYWHILARAIPPLVFTSSATYTLQPLWGWVKAMQLCNSHSFSILLFHP